jgi:microcystin-dependent protein
MSHEEEIAAAVRPSATPAAGAPPPVPAKSPLTPGIVTAISGTWPNQLFSVTIGGAATASTNRRALSSYVSGVVGDVVWLLPVGTIDGPDWLIIGAIQASPAAGPGDIKSGGWAAAPAGWVLCDGTSYSTGGIYAALFGVIGYTYGGSGASFRVPDLRGRFPIGAGAGVGLTSRALGATGGEENHILSEAELAVHMHNVHSTGTTNTTHNHASVGGLSEVASPNAANNTIVTSDGAGSNAGHNTVPPFVAVSYAIKL